MSSSGERDSGTRELEASDDALLADLARAAGPDRDPADPSVADLNGSPAPEEIAWERLARGKGTLAEAEADARARGLGEEEVDALRALYVPVGELAHARIRASMPEPRGKRGPRRVLVGGAFAVAAAVLLFAWPRETALPSYTLERHGGDATQRSDAHAPARYGAEDRLEIVLRPARRLEAAVGARVLLDGRLWDAPLEVSPTGAVRLRGEGALLSLGHHELTFVVASPERISEVARALSRDPGASPANAVIRRVQLERVP